MSEERAPYGVAYTVEPPKPNLKVGDRVQVIDTDILRCEYMGYKGTVVENPNPANGCVRVALRRHGLSADFRPEWLSKLDTVPPNPVNPNVVRFQAIVNEMANTYAAKNHDYGDAYSEGYRLFGHTQLLSRIHEKFCRVYNLLEHGGGKVLGETVADTLTDMANQCIILRMMIEDNDFEKVK